MGEVCRSTGTARSAERKGGSRRHSEEKLGACAPSTWALRTEGEGGEMTQSQTGYKVGRSLGNVHDRLYQGMTNGFLE